MNDEARKRYIKGINGKMVEHTQVLFRVSSERPDKPGVPDELVLVLDDDAVELSRDPQANHFISGWVPTSTIMGR